MKFQKNIRFVVTFLSSLVFFGVSSQIAWADCAPSARCCGSTCERLDPETTLCYLGASQVEEATIYDEADPSTVLGQVALFYSSRCNAYYSKATRTFSSYYAPLFGVWGERVGDMVHSFGYRWITSNRDFSVVSTMTDGSYSIRSCTLVLEPSGYHGNACTPYAPAHM